MSKITVRTSPTSDGYYWEYCAEANEVREWHSGTGLNCGVTYNVGSMAEARAIILRAHTATRIDEAHKRGDMDAAFIAETVAAVFTK